jgi:SRSO17 transposase
VRICNSCLIVAESSFPKQGERSVGVARQCSVDNCQVAVFGFMSNSRQHVPVDMRLYLPKVWIDDVRRCDEAGVPAAARQPRRASTSWTSSVARGQRAGAVGF